MTNNTKPLLGQIAAVLSYVYKIIKVSFDLYALVRFGH